MAVNEKAQCRICFDEEGKLFSPCRCSGTSAFVHEGCLQQWLQVKKNPQSCDVCGFRWPLVVKNQSLWQLWKRPISENVVKRRVKLPHAEIHTLHVLLHCLELAGGSVNGPVEAGLKSKIINGSFLYLILCTSYMFVAGVRVAKLMEKMEMSDFADWFFDVYIENTTIRVPRINARYTATTSFSKRIALSLTRTIALLFFKVNIEIAAAKLVIKEFFSFPLLSNITNNTNNNNNDNNNIVAAAANINIINDPANQNAIVAAVVAREQLRQFHQQLQNEIIDNNNNDNNNNNNNNNNEQLQPLIRAEAVRKNNWRKRLINIVQWIHDKGPSFHVMHAFIRSYRIIRNGRANKSIRMIWLSDLFLMSVLPKNEWFLLFVLVVHIFAQQFAWRNHLAKCIGDDLFLKNLIPSSH